VRISLETLEVGERVEATLPTGPPQLLGDMRHIGSVTGIPHPMHKPCFPRGTVVSEHVPFSGSIDPLTPLLVKYSIL
jgi:hypothetical protein